MPASAARRDRRKSDTRLTVYLPVRYNCRIGVCSSASIVALKDGAYIREYISDDNGHVSCDIAIVVLPPGSSVIYEHRGVGSRAKTITETIRYDEPAAIISRYRTLNLMRS